MEIGNYTKEEFWHINLANLQKSKILEDLQKEKMEDDIHLYPYSLRRFIDKIQELERRMGKHVPIALEAKDLEVENFMLGPQNRYLLVCKTPIGKGGMGSVYPFWDRQDNQLMAVKLVKLDNPSDSETSGMNQMLMAEAKTLSRLSHPNIVRYYDCGITNLMGATSIYLATEYIDGIPLSSYSLTDSYWSRVYGEANQKLDDLLRKVLQYVYQIGQATEYLHEEGLVHRDITPDNILVINDSPRLIDFGIAQRVEAHGHFKSAYGVASILGKTGFVDPSLARFSEILANAQECLERKNWRAFQKSRKDLKSFWKSYRERSRPLRKYLNSLAWSTWFQYGRRKKLNWAPLYREEWQDLQNKVSEIRFCSDPKEDMFCLGATLYWCLTGEKPYSDFEEVQVNWRPPVKELIALRNFIKPQEIKETFAYLEDLIAQALSIPEKRCSLRKFLKALKPLTEDIYFSRKER